MKNLLTKYEEQILYIVFGIATTLVNFITYFLLIKINVPYLISNAVAICISIIFAYVTNKIWVFKSNTKSAKTIFKEFISFISCRIISSICDMGSMFVLISILYSNDFIAKIITCIIVVILNYVFSKFIIFKKGKEYV